MANIASKNQYELLGNDPELDPDREPEPPTKAIDKPVTRLGKRNGGAEDPSPDTARPRGGGRGGRHEVFTGSEQAFRDRTAGAPNNRSKPPDDGLRVDRHPDRLRGPNEHRDIDGRPRSSRGGNRGQGYRGTRTGRDDRHSRTGIQEHEKQAAHGWGGNTGESELADEKMGEQIAKEEEKEGFDSVVPPPVNAEGETWAPEGVDTTWAPDTTADSTGVNSSAPAIEAEPEDKSKSYADYLAELAAKKLALGGDKLDARKPNEGGSKKFPEGKAFARDEGEDYVAGSGGKAKRDRQRKEKTMVELDDTRLREAPREPFSGRGRGRGRGEGGFRGEGRGRGGRGGGRGGERGGSRGDRGDRGDFRGGRGGRGDRGPSGPNVADTNAFPELGK